MSRLDVGEHVSLRANTDRARPIISRLLFELLERTRVKLHALVTSPTQASHIQVCDGFRLDARIDSIVSISIDHELIRGSPFMMLSLVHTDDGFTGGSPFHVHE